MLAILWCILSLAVFVFWVFCAYLAGRLDERTEADKENGGFSWTAAILTALASPVLLLTAGIMGLKEEFRR